MFLDLGVIYAVNLEWLSSQGNKNFVREAIKGEAAKSTMKLMFLLS